MKTLLLTAGLLIAVDCYCQKYNIGIIKTGSAIKNIQGQIIVSDSTVTSDIQGQFSTFKIISRKEYTIHVTDGAITGWYVISPAIGRLRGFTYERRVAYYPDKPPPGKPTSVYYCAIQNY